MIRLTRLPTTGALCLPGRETVDSRADADVERDVAAIVADVRARGDEALIEATRRYDGWAVSAPTLEVSRADRSAALAQVSDDVRSLLKTAADRIRRFHEPQLASGYTLSDEQGVRLAQRVVPLARVGLYVPGGTAAYPSSVLMNAIPAQVAGVDEIIMVTPTPGGVLSPVVVAAAAEAGVHRIFRVGGAQAVAALAYGTDRVPRVDKIVGPGNIWVATAKRQVFGAVDIDSIAGPSEVLIVADETADPSLVAADMLAQAEHDPLASAGLITTDANLVPRVEQALTKQLELLSRREIAETSLRERGFVVVADDRAAAIRMANEVAAEHLELLVRDPAEAAQHIRHAGAIFIGPWTPEAVGDYLAGPNHVLPTGGTARFFSGLGVGDFVKRVNLLEFTRSGLEEVASLTAQFAALEGLDAHAASIAARQKIKTR